MRSLFALLISAVLLAHADAATFRVESGIVYVTGPIEKGDGARFGALHSDERPRLIVLASEGGEVRDALTMAYLIQGIGVPTLIPENAVCWSACSVLFFAGTSRYVGKGGILGVHSSSAGSDKKSDNGNKMMIEFLRPMPYMARVIVAIKDTPPDGMWIVPQDQWASLGIDEWPAP